MCVNMPAQYLETGAWCQARMCWCARCCWAGDGAWPAWEQLRADGGHGQLPRVVTLFSTPTVLAAYIPHAVPSPGQLTAILLHELPAVLNWRVLEAAHSNSPSVLPRKVDCQGIQPLALAAVGQPCHNCQLSWHNLQREGSQSQRVSAGIASGVGSQLARRA